MKLIPTDNITLDNVKKSNYWKLISIVVWNHYIEEKFQDESMLTFGESYYGKAKNGGGTSSHGDKWNNTEYTEEYYTRTLSSIVITFKRSDTTTYFYINVETGNLTFFGFYNDKDKNGSPTWSHKPLHICNWLLENDFLTISND